MLRALYEYAQRMNLVLPVGYADKTVKAFLHLTSDGTFTGLVEGSAAPFRCPDIGSLANGTDKSNVLVEKRSVVFPPASTAKYTFFHNALEDLGRSEPRAAVCVKALDDPAVCEKMRQTLDEHKIKDSDRISFMVDFVRLVECDTVRPWWDSYRLQFQKPGQSKDLVPCLITGQPTTPVNTVLPNQGLRVVGGHSRGDALICFDKPAFCSYGLKQCANAPVSPEAYSQIKVALDTLLSDAPILAGCKFVHWYDKPLPAEETDPVSVWVMPGDEDDGDEETAVTPMEMRQAERSATALIDSVHTGKEARLLPNLYYIAMLSGVNGRVMVRRFHSGSYEALQENLNQWNDQLRLTNSFATGTLPPVKLVARLIHLLKKQKTDKKVFDRLSKELSGLSNAILMAILTGAPLPDAVAVRSLSYIRSQMLEDDQISPDPIACQWLKAWLMRNHKEESIMPNYDPQNQSTAYQCGALVAVYAKIQKRAYPDVNVSVVQRYFASAMQTPALVLGQLAKLSVHHLGKLEKGPAIYFENRLAQISTAIQGPVPATFTVPQQAQFALGYYQMCAELNKKAEKPEKEDKQEAE